MLLTSGFVPVTQEFVRAAPFTASRSWLPPGTACTYDLRDTGIPAEEPLVIGPSPVRLLVVGAGLSGFPSTCTCGGC